MITLGVYAVLLGGEAPPGAPIMTKLPIIYPLHVLVVEDSQSDMMLIVEELRRMDRPVECHRVLDENTMRAALAARHWDVILCDWTLPRFSGANALAVARQVDVDLPFIIVSGTISEESAVDAMRAGAHDYVLKDKLARLVPAVERELRDSSSRRERRRTEEALRISEARFRRLAESGIVGILITDLSGHVRDANDAYLQTMGYSRQEMMSGYVQLAELTPLEWRAADVVANERLEQDGIMPLREKEYLRKDGTRVPVLVGGAMLESSMCIAFVADLTERKRAEKALAASEEQLRQAQKMEAVGRLAGGVAHDFNNILSVILPYAEVLRCELSATDPLLEFVSEISTAGERAAELTKQLLMFSRKQMLAPQVLDLGVVIEQMDKMLRRLIPEDVELTIAFAAPGGMVKADRGSIEQVIMNLVVNARDAMPTGGKLTIATCNATIDSDGEAGLVELGPGPYVKLDVTDTGVGMDLATQARIFEPFFTTKAKDKGTGLGLSTVFGIVRQSGGGVRVRSEPGKGTTFEVYLPVSNEAAEPVYPVVAPLTIRGSETVLLVEDEDQVRAAASNILRRSGYVVLEARNGPEALAMSEGRPEGIDLLLTDVVMPLMSGPELAKRLVASRTDLRVLCMSGHTDDSNIRHGVLRSEIHYLQKPITVDSLERKVREVLDAPIRRWPS